MGNIFFWDTTYRPFAGVVYSTLFHFFGMDPLPYYITGFVIRVVNLGLLFLLLTRITQKPLLAAITTALSAIHWETSDAIYNFGSVFELLAFCFFLVSFNLYLSFLKSDRAGRKYYLAAVLAYVFALNSKEIAITLPVIILIYEWIYKPGEEKQWNRFLWLLPFFGIGIIYALGKLFGQDTYLEIPAFEYVWDAEVFKNLEKYVEKLFYNQVDLNTFGVLLLLLAGLGIALLLRSKEMTFGLIYFLITLIPVIGLRRFWGLYLYIPMAGIVLYGVAFFVELGKRIFKSPVPMKFVYGGLILWFVLLLTIQYPKFVSATEKYFIGPGRLNGIFINSCSEHIPMSHTVQHSHLKTRRWMDTIFILLCG